MSAHKAAATRAPARSALVTACVSLATSTASCRDVGVVPVSAEPDAILIAAALDSSGSVIDVRLVESTEVRLDLGEGSRALLFSIAPADLVLGEGGGPIPAEWRAGLRVRPARAFDPESGGAGSCKRCLGPVDLRPLPVYPGESCPLPPSATALEEDRSAADPAGAARARAEILIEWPGACTWPHAEPRRCAPGAPGSRGLRSDCRADVTAADAWPDRVVEPPPLELIEHARGCAVAGTCYADDSPLHAARVSAECAAVFDPDEERAILVGSPGGNLSPIDSRWGRFARGVGAGGGCVAAAGLTKPRSPKITCTEAGCSWDLDRTRPSVECQGTVAILSEGATVTRRDCADALAACDPTSSTGCTDRHTAPCNLEASGLPARDRCDGNVKLGCTPRGQITFHDCGRLAGGRCVEDSLGAKCVYPKSDRCLPGEPLACRGSSFVACVLGEPIEVDCVALGLRACANGVCVREN